MKLLVISLLFVMSCGIPLKVIREWKYVDFVWDSEDPSEYGGYNATECVLYDVDISKDGRIFVTSVREKGVPASVMTVTNKAGKGGPLLRPYPDWSWYKLNGSCSERITSAYRVDIKCDHLFVLDCGQNGDDVVCPSQLLIFDLKTDKMVKRVEIPYKVAGDINGTSLLVTPIVDVQCCDDVLNNAVVYMADTQGVGLVVWQACYNKFCRFVSEYMYPTNPYFTIEGESFILNDGILGMTFTRGDLYYAALSGDEIYRMNECTLTGKCLSPNETDKLTQPVVELSGQTGPMASKDCAIFFSNVPETSILCADTGKQKPINSSNMDVIAYNPEILQFASGMKVRKSKDCKDKLLIMTNRFQRGMDNTRNLSEINYRIIEISVDDIRRNTSCFESCDNDYYSHRHHHCHDRCHDRYDHCHNYHDCRDRYKHCHNYHDRRDRYKHCHNYHDRHDRYHHRYGRYDHYYDHYRNNRHDHSDED